MKGFRVFIFTVFIFAFTAESLIAQPYRNSPSDKVTIPEVVWAPATGGGTWVSDVQITVRNSGGTDVSVYFEYDGGLRGPFFIWTNATMYHSLKINNILWYLQTFYDPTFDYYGRVGALAFYTQDTAHRIYATARVYNGIYSKTIQGLNRYEPANTANINREMVVQNLTQNSAYRTAIALWEETGSSLTISFILIDADNNTIGTSWTETISGLRYMAFNPFAKAGVGGGTYDNCWLYINPTGGSGSVMVIGATSHNTSNDPAYHIAVQYRH
jgi:hypothetical protein